MLIETIKNHPCGRREETLKMATLPGHTVDMPDVRARVPECRLINSRWIYGYHYRRTTDIVVSPSLSLSPSPLFHTNFVSYRLSAFELTSRKSRTRRLISRDEICGIFE